MLTTFLDDPNAELSRVRNIVLSVNLARHSANDCTNPALPDDFYAIEKLMHIDRKTLLERLSLPDDLLQKYLAQPNPTHD